MGAVHPWWASTTTRSTSRRSFSAAARPIVLSGADR
jgi:hypothetical protein